MITWNENKGIDEFEKDNLVNLVTKIREDAFSGCENLVIHLSEKSNLQDFELKGCKEAMRDFD